jgi:hypothetical protein
MMPNGTLHQTMWTRSPSCSGGIERQAFQAMSQAIAFADESIWPCKKLLWSGLLKIHTASILRNLIRKRYSAIEGFGFVESLAQSIGRRWREWQMKAPSIQ